MTPGNPTVDFHGEKRSNDTHQSTTDPESRLARKSGGHEAKLAFCGNVMIENRNGLIVDTELVQCSGTAERNAAVTAGPDSVWPAVVKSQSFRPVAASRQ